MEKTGFHQIMLQKYSLCKSAKKKKNKGEAVYTGESW